MISCCSGFIEGDTAFVVYQLNHRERLKQNPSLTNRAFLISHLIGMKINDLVFIGGCMGVLQHSCVPENDAKIWIMRRSFRTFPLLVLTYSKAPLAEVPKLLVAWMRPLRPAKKKPDAYSVASEPPGL